MDKEPEVDPYFSDALKSGDHKRMEKAIRTYLGLYLKPSTLEKLVMVSGEFFAADNRTEDYRYIPTFKDEGHPGGSEVPPTGTMILNIDTAKAKWSGDESKIFHDLLVYGMVIEYVLSHPEDTRLKKPLDAWSWNVGFGGLLRCLSRDILHRNYGSSDVLVVYVAPDLSAIYSNFDFYPVKIIKYLSGDRIVLHHYQMDHHVSFAVKHRYQPQEYDKLKPDQIEKKIEDWKIDDVIQAYDSGHSRWLTDDVFASTFVWADDGLIYALSADGSDELFSAFIARNPRRLLELVSGKDIRPLGEWGKEHFDSVEKLTSLALARHNWRFDGLFFKKPSFTAQDLDTLAALKRYDLLRIVPVEKLDLSNPDRMNHRLREDLFENLGRISDPTEVPELKKILEIYWPIFKRTLPKTEEAEDEDDRLIIRAVKNLLAPQLQFSSPDLTIYHTLKKIDPKAVEEWIRSIKPKDWNLFRSEEMYEELNEIRPITDDEIVQVIRDYFDSEAHRRGKGKTGAKWGNGEMFYIDSLHPSLKKRFKTLNDEKQIWVKLGYIGDDDSDSDDD